MPPRVPSGHTALIRRPGYHRGARRPHAALCPRWPPLVLSGESSALLLTARERRGRLFGPLGRLQLFSRLLGKGPQGGSSGRVASPKLCGEGHGGFRQGALRSPHGRDRAQNSGRAPVPAPGVSWHHRRAVHPRRSRRPAQGPGTSCSFGSPSQHQAPAALE